MVEFEAKNWNPIRYKFKGKFVFRYFVSNSIIVLLRSLCFGLSLTQKNFFSLWNQTLDKALFTRDISVHNIAIKRYCDIWHFLATDFYWTTKVSSYQNLVYLVLWFDESLPWPIDIHGPKISFYRNIVRQNVSCE